MEITEAQAAEKSYKNGFYLYKRRVLERASIGEIAEELDTTKGTVSRWCHNFGVDIHSPETFSGERIDTAFCLRSIPRLSPKIPPPPVTKEDTQRHFKDREACFYKQAQRLMSGKPIGICKEGL